MSPAIKEFWRRWLHKTKTEKQAIASIITSVRVLFDKIPPSKICAIYIKGSFIRREMKPGSDVDIVPITFDDPTLKKIQKLEEREGGSYKPAEFLPHSLREFKSGKRRITSPNKKGESISLFETCTGIN